MRSLRSDWQAAVVLLAALSYTAEPQAVQAQSGFILSVRIHRYSNPMHRLGVSMRCCDGGNFSVCENPCNNSFTFCLRPYGNPHLAMSSSYCPFGRYYVPAFCSSSTPDSDTTRRSQQGVDCDLLEFTDDDDSFGSASNPLTFSGDSWPGGFQLVTTVENVDTPNEDGFVDAIITEQWLDAGSSTRQMEFPGVYKIGLMQMSFRVTCNENFGGPNCTAYCGVEGCRSSGGTTAAIVGGVVGGVVLLVLLVLGIIMLVVVVVVCRRRRSEDHAYLKPDSVTGEGFDPGDNPTYAGTTSTHAVYASETDSESSLYHKLENPMYGAVENHDYAIPEAHSPGGVSSGHYSTISDGASPPPSSHHYEYVEHSGIPTAISSSSSESELSDNNNEFSNTHYDKLLH